MDVKSTLQPTNLCLEVYGKEKLHRGTASSDRDYPNEGGATNRANNSSTTTACTMSDSVKTSFFFVQLDLHRTTNPIVPNRYVIPFSVPLPKSLPASRTRRRSSNDCTHYVGGSEATTLDRYNQLCTTMLSSFSVQYTVKLKCDLPWKFPNKRSFLVSPPPMPIRPVPFVLQPKPWNIEGLRIVHDRRGYQQVNELIYLAIRAKETTAVRGGTITLSLACRNVSTYPLSGMRVTLEQEECCYHDDGTWNKTLRDDIRSIDSTSALDVRHRSQKAILFDLNPVPFQLEGVRLGCLSRHGTMMGTNNELDINEEVIAEEMFRSLHLPSNEVDIAIPTTAMESYTGVYVEIQHFITVELMIPAYGGGKGVSRNLPSLRFPIQVVGTSTATTIEQPITSSATSPQVMSGSAECMEQKGRQMLNPLYDSDSVTLPWAVPSPGGQTFNRNGIEPPDQCNDRTGHFNSHNRRIYHQAVPSLPGFLDELSGSMDGYDFVKEKLKILDFAILLGSMTPDEFGSVVAHTSPEFCKPRIGALLAQNYGGDFTCDHVVAAIENTSVTLRVNMVQGLLGFCSDLAEQNELVRSRLTDYEQAVVARHSIGVVVEETSNPTHKAARISSNKKDGAGDQDSRGDRHTNRNHPRKEDICIDDSMELHPGNLQYARGIGKLVSHGPTQDFSSLLVKEIKKQFSYCRFMVRPLKDSSPDYWREASAKEISEFVRLSYNREVANNRLATKIATFSPQAREKPSSAMERLEKRLRNVTDNDWPVDVATKDRDVVTPTRQDVCLGCNEDWPGNRAMIRAINRVVADGLEWCPQVCTQLDRFLVGRRFFVQTGTPSQWKEASVEERHEILRRYFDKRRPEGVEPKPERRQQKQQQQTSSLSSKTYTASPGGEPSTRKSKRPANRTSAPRQIVPSKIHEVTNPTFVTLTSSPGNFQTTMMHQPPLRVRSCLLKSDVESTNGSSSNGMAATKMCHEHLLLSEQTSSSSLSPLQSPEKKKSKCSPTFSSFDDGSMRHSPKSRSVTEQNLLLWEGSLPPPPIATTQRIIRRRLRRRNSPNGTTKKYVISEPESYRSNSISSSNRRMVPIRRPNASEDGDCTEEDDGGVGRELLFISPRRRGRKRTPQMNQ